MIAATLLAPSLQAPRRIHEHAWNPTFRSALQRACDLLNLAETMSPLKVHAYRLFTEDDYDFTPEEIARKFKAASWPNLQSAPSVRKLLDKIRTHVEQQFEEIQSLRSCSSDFDPDHLPLTPSDVSKIAERVKLTLKELEAIIPENQSSTVGPIITRHISQLVGLLNHEEESVEIDGFEEIQPYLEFILTRCVPSQQRATGRSGYFPFELLYYAAIHLPHLVPPIENWELNPEIPLADEIQEGLRPERRIQEIWRRVPVPPQYAMEGRTRKWGYLHMPLKESPAYKHEVAQEPAPDEPSTR
jgi:hypothetical protein